MNKKAAYLPLPLAGFSQTVLLHYLLPTSKRSTDFQFIVSRAKLLGLYMFKYFQETN